MPTKIHETQNIEIMFSVLRLPKHCVHLCVWRVCGVVCEGGRVMGIHLSCSSTLFCLALFSSTLHYEFRNEAILKRQL